MKLFKYLSAVPIPCRIANPLYVFIQTSILFSSPVLFSSDYGQLLSTYSFGVIVTAAFLTWTKLLSRLLCLETVIFLNLSAIAGYGFLISLGSNKSFLLITYFLLGSVAVCLQIFSRLFYGRYYENQPEMQSHVSAAANIFLASGTLGGYFICGFSMTYLPYYTWHICLVISVTALIFAIYQNLKRRSRKQG